MPMQMTFVYFQPKVHNYCIIMWQFKTLKKNWYKRHKEQWLMKTENKIHDVFILYNQKNSQFSWWGNSMEAKFISHHKANDDFFVTYWNPVLQKDNSLSKRRTWSKGV